MIIGKPLSELEKYLPKLTKEPDFESFWQSSLDALIDSDPVLIPFDSPIKTIEIFDVTIKGFNGDPIKGWFLQPKGINENRPVINIFEGYGGGRGEAIEWLFWPIEPPHPSDPFHL